MLLKSSTVASGFPVFIRASAWPCSRSTTGADLAADCRKGAPGAPQCNLGAASACLGHRGGQRRAEPLLHGLCRCRVSFQTSCRDWLDNAVAADFRDDVLVLPAVSVDSQIRGSRSTAGCYRGGAMWLRAQGAQHRETAFRRLNVINRKIPPGYAASDRGTGVVAVIRALIRPYRLCRCHALGRQAISPALHFNEYRKSTGKRYDEIICAGISAVKWLANKEPEADWTGIQRSILDVLAKVHTDRFVLISTIDVYPDQSQPLDEDAKLRGLPKEPYGRHGRAVEEWIAERFPKHSIVRLPALFGTGLKKNALYDLLHANMIEKINPASAFQWYPTSRLAEDLTRISEAGLRVVNLFTEPVMMREVVEQFFPGAKIGLEAGPAVSYSLRTRHAKLFGGHPLYVMSADQILVAMNHFIDQERQRWAFPGAAISNIAWPAGAMPKRSIYTSRRLCRDRIGSCQVVRPMGGYRAATGPHRGGGSCRARNFKVIALQGLLFGVPGAKLFGSDAERAALSNHLGFIAQIAGACGGVPCVFGAPGPVIPEQSRPGSGTRTRRRIFCRDRASVRS